MSHGSFKGHRKSPAPQPTERLGLVPRMLLASPVAHPVLSSLSTTALSEQHGLSVLLARPSAVQHLGSLTYDLFLHQSQLSPLS